MKMCKTFHGVLCSIFLFSQYFSCILVVITGKYSLHVVTLKWNRILAEHIFLFCCVNKYFRSCILHNAKNVKMGLFIIFHKEKCEVNLQVFLVCLVILRPIWLSYFGCNS